jgi:hypothetical protein
LITTRFELMLVQVPLVRLADLDVAAVVLLSRLANELGHECGPTLVDVFSLIVLLVVSTHVVRPDGDLGSSPAADHLDQHFVCGVGAVNVEDHKVGVKCRHIMFGYTIQPLRSKPADRPVNDFEVGMRKTLAQVRCDGLPPRPLGDRLTIKQNSDLVATLRRAGGQERHGPLNAAAELRRLGGRRRGHGGIFRRRLPGCAKPRADYEQYNQRRYTRRPRTHR